jgi:hypothetical protein
MIGACVKHILEPPPSLSDTFSFARPEVIDIIPITMNQMHRIFFFGGIPISIDSNPMCQRHHIAYTMSMPSPTKIKGILSS